MDEVVFLENGIAAFNLARQLISLVPEANVAPSTLRVYEAAFRRMQVEDCFDPVAMARSEGSYYSYRAALLCIGRRRLVSAVYGVRGAKRRYFEHDQIEWLRTVIQRLDVLMYWVARLAPAFERDPPQGGGASTGAPTRWVIERGSGVRKRGSKKAAVAELPRGWRAGFWQHVPSDSAYCAAIAVLMLTAVRPAELVPTDSGDGLTGGVDVCLEDGGRLQLASRPVKTRDRARPKMSRTIVSIADSGAPARYLADLCRENGGSLRVQIASANALRKTIKRIGKVAFGDAFEFDATPYVFRHQRISDAKALFGAGSEVAIAAGHVGDRGQSGYGDASNGEPQGLIALTGNWEPRRDSIARVERLAGRRANPGPIGK